MRMQYSIASAPPLVKKVRFRSPGVTSASISARRAAGRLAKVGAQPGLLFGGDRLQAPGAVPPPERPAHQLIRVGVGHSLLDALDTGGLESGAESRRPDLLGLLQDSEGCGPVRDRRRGRQVGE